MAKIHLAVGNLGPYPQRLRAVEARLTGAATHELASFALGDGDRDGLVAADSPDATVASKWDRLQTLIARGLAVFATRAGE